MSYKSKGITKSSKQVSKVKLHRLRVKKANKKFNILKRNIFRAKDLARNVVTTVDVNS